MPRKKIKRPIKADILIGSLVFVMLVCAVLSYEAYQIMRTSLTNRYEDVSEELLKTLDHMIDKEDLKECMRTEEPSEKYEELQEQMNYMVDDFELDHLYCITASNTTIKNVVSAVGKEDRDNGVRPLAINEIYGYFPNDELKRYSSFWHNDSITFFQELTHEGLFYTGAMPIKDSDGKTFALMCVDISVSNLQSITKSYVLPIVLSIFAISLIFTSLLVLWISRQVTRPISDLEASVSEYAKKSHQLRDIGEMKLDLSSIRTGNEVESLAAAVEKMSEDMQHYVRNIVFAETRAESAEKEARNMTLIAYHDALTHVKSKAAYDLKVKELDDSIGKGTAEFGIVMVDLNNLKLVNDSFGHEKGDEYLTGACRQICEIYSHSPVYRIGGDEFAVVLEGDDYRNRDDLFRKLVGRFSESRSDGSRPLWECYSAAGGRGIYSGTSGETAEDVLKHADAAMYDDKQKMKSAAASGEIVDRIYQELAKA